MLNPLVATPNNVGSRTTPLSLRGLPKISGFKSVPNHWERAGVRCCIQSAVREHCGATGRREGVTSYEEVLARNVQAYDGAVGERSGMHLSGWKQDEHEMFASRLTA